MSRLRRAPWARESYRLIIDARRRTARLTGPHGEDSRFGIDPTRECWRLSTNLDQARRLLSDYRAQEYEVQDDTREIVG